MDKIKIDWEYCYGIKSLKHEFSFSEGKHSHLTKVSHPLKH